MAETAQDREIPAGCPVSGQMARLAQLSGTKSTADSLHLMVRSNSSSSLRGLCQL